MPNILMFRILIFRKEGYFSLKAYFLPLGAGAEQGLPALLAAFGCGAARQAAAVSMLRIPASAPSSMTDRLLEDLAFCHRSFSGEDAFAFFRTQWDCSLWIPVLPDRDALIENQESRLLLQALRGEGAPFSFRTDREAAEWSFSALLAQLSGSNDASPDQSSADAPFRALLAALDQDLATGEDVRLMLLCDLSEGYAAGLALGLIRFFRARYGEKGPFLGLVAQARAHGPAAKEGARACHEFLSALRDRNLIRLDSDRDTLGADALWLLGLPASLHLGEETNQLLDWAAARILGQVWTSASRPAPGLHTREMPGVFTLQALDQEARSAATFLRGAFWCLCDLFPALRSYLDHPAALRSLAPASRGGLFRKLFRAGEGSRPPEALPILERAFKALCLQALSLLSALPPLTRQAAPAAQLWEEAVKACGRAVTLGSEYDVRRQEAEDSGVDKVNPVHRVSLSDTEEEELLRQLDQMGAQLAGAIQHRAEIFHQLGGHFSRLALQDCLEKCQRAEQSARDKLIQMPSGDPEARYALGLQERRVRLLQAAIARCHQDLAAAAVWDTLSEAGSFRGAGPLENEILSPALSALCLTMLTGEGEGAQEAAKALREGLSALLQGYQLNDAKTLLKNLVSVCRQPEGDAPLRSLVVGVFSVCGVEISGLRFTTGSGPLPATPLLPDLTEGDRLFTLPVAPERILSPAIADQTAARRGLLALMILRQYRRRGPLEAALELLPLRPESSILAEVYLSSRHAAQASLCYLRQGEGEEALRQPLAILLPGQGLEPARLPSDLKLWPDFAFWIDREARQPLDPCPYLSEADRQILTEQITRLRAALNQSGSSPFLDFLSDFHRDIMQAPRQAGDMEGLRRRLRVAYGLSRLPIWQKDLQQVSSFYESSLPADPVCAQLSGQPDFSAAACSLREDVLYVFRNVPLARENAHHLLESVHAPQEEFHLASLDTECDILFHSSDDYHEALAEGVQRLLRRYPEAEAEAISVAQELLKEAQAPISERVTELTWPWDQVSASVLTILSECLGPDLAPAALHAFSERVALFPARGGEILGDVLLSQACLLRRAAPAFAEGEEIPDPDAAAGNPAPAPEIRPDAVLPPLSPDFARALCRSSRGQSLVQPGFLCFEPDGTSLRVTLTLEGAFTLKLIRVYQPEEIHSFYAHDLPTLALWPSLPFPADRWRAYYSYAHSPADFSFTALTQEEEIPLTGDALRWTAQSQEYPLGYLLKYQGQDIGALPNLLPPPEEAVSGPWTACLDFGSAATSLIFTDGVSRWPMQGPVTVRTLLRSPVATEDLLWREFLPAVPVSTLLPGALRIFRREAEEDAPLRDAAIFMSSSLRDVLDVHADALYTDLKWNGEKGRATGLYLHQVMLLAALQARCGGAQTLAWRLSLPEEMAPEGRERLAQTVQSLAETVSRESGLPLPEKIPRVAFACESTALGAYFRFVSPDQTRGGFMALDLGADTADLSLFLRGREEAVRACQLPLGLHNMLLPALLRRPSLLSEDFGFVENEAFQQDLQALEALLAQAGRDPAALRQARYGLDAILADHLPLFLEALGRRRAAGEPGRTGALFLLQTSFLMMLSGLLLLQISGDALRNDDLPDAMTLFLAGRGSLLIERLSLEAKTSLWKMLTMFRNNRVRSLNLFFSAEKKLEIPVGLSLMDRASAALPHAAPSPAAIAVRPEELLPEFLLRFRREFPTEAALLFPGVYTNDYYSPFTPYGQQLLPQALQASFERPEAVGKPFPALIACLNHLLEMIQEGYPLS